MPFVGMKVLKRMKREQKVALLKHVRKMLARPKGWSEQGWFAVTDKPYDAYCLAAACQLAAKDLGVIKDGMDGGIFRTEVADEISLLKVVKERGYTSVPHFNDSEDTRKKDVLAVIDERIAQIEAGTK